MNNKVLAVIIVLILLGGGAYLYSKREAQSPVEENLQNQNSSQDTTQATTSPSPQTGTQTNQNSNEPNNNSGTFSSGEEQVDGGSGIQVVEVDYTDAGFNPKSVDIKVNDYVFFKNTSTKNFWPASVNGAYAEFDSKQAITPGKQFKFQFTKAGIWNFNNKLEASEQGTVNVTK